MSEIAVVYHSGYGHTAKVAAAVAEGASAALYSTEALDEAAWAVLDGARAIIFGAPTYMGGVSAPFKGFIDSTSKRWLAQTWKDKIAGGFTNSSTMGGDNLNALYQLMVFAMQHSMIWVGNATLPHNGLNRIGAYSGLMTQSDNDSPEVTPPAGDLETARLYGARVAAIARQL